MKKALLYALTLALALSLTACGQPKAEQPTDPTPSTSVPEPIKDTTLGPEPEQTPATPVETEDTQPPEETDPQEEPMQTEDTEPVEVVEPPAGTAPEQLADTAPETPAEKPQEVIPAKPPKTETESKPSQEPVSQPPAQQEPTEQQPAEQQPSESQGGGGDSAAEIEARKQAFLNGMNQMFEDHGYSTSGDDHDYTEEEKQALLKALGQ